MPSHLMLKGSPMRRSVMVVLLLHRPPAGAARHPLRGTLRVRAGRGPGEGRSQRCGALLQGLDTRW